MCLAQGHNALTSARLEPAASRSRVKHSTTEPLSSSMYSLYSMYSLHSLYSLHTVNSEIFAMVLFSRNFAYAKFRGNKILTNRLNHSVVH